MALSDVPQDIKEKYLVREWHHASAVLAHDFAEQWQEIIDVLRNVTLRTTDILAEGGGKTTIAAEIDADFRARGWDEVSFHTEISLQMMKGKLKSGTPKVYQSPTHQVDEYKDNVAVELEWNNKDPFFDRDLNNFRLLFDLRAISVGVIITRTDELQRIFDALGVGGKYGPTTTHFSRLERRLDGGSGGGCPVLVFALSPALYEVDMTDSQVVEYVAKRGEERQRKKEQEAKDKEERRIRAEERRRIAAQKRADAEAARQERARQKAERAQAKSGTAERTLLDDPGGSSVAL